MSAVPARLACLSAFGATAKVWDKSKVVIIPDHYIFTADSKSNRNVDILRDFVREQEIAQDIDVRSEEHTSELQSHSDLVCRLLLEKNNTAARKARLSAIGLQPG